MTILVEKVKLGVGLSTVALLLLFASACQAAPTGSGSPPTGEKPVATPSQPRAAPLVQPNLLKDRAFEDWPVGSTQPPGGWTLERALVTAVRATERVGPVWARVTANGSWARLQYSIPNPADYAGKTLTFSAWVRGEPQNPHEQRIGIMDSEGQSVSPVVSKDGEFHFLSVTRKIAPSATWIEVNLFANFSAAEDAQDVAYFDSVMLVEGEYSLAALTPTATPTVVASPSAVRPTPTPVVVRNLLKNEGFERWSKGPNGAPDDWSLERASVSREEGTKKVGPFAARVKSEGNWSRLQYAVPEYGYYRGKTLTLMVWARAEPGNDRRQTISLSDYAGQTTASFLKKDGQFHLVSVTRRIFEDTGAVEVNLFANFSAEPDNDDVVYYDNPVLIEGTGPQLPWALP